MTNWNLRFRGNRYWLKTDRVRLRQVMLNLIGNAIKFTRNGSIEIEAEALPDDKTLEIRVIDTGIGIAEDRLERIFEDFTTLDTSFGPARPTERAWAWVSHAVSQKRWAERSALKASWEREVSSGSGCLLSCRTQVYRSRHWPRDYGHRRGMSRWLPR